MQEAANVLALVDQYPEVRKRCQYLAVVEKAFTKPGGGSGIVRSLENHPCTGTGALGVRVTV